ncbi:hypothetical protein [Bosea minatitlanensis]|uniref:Uncharacterized protein n=1 Tax=Bosea minatitlanensis TaxID=128782 RepID=A0ABW0EZJ3_9HYPH|nr:hypothetical protein [Bosea minatitlanensis]MCT4492726.1 hypothetical protein [Bosea minatitlanensis]
MTMDLRALIDACRAEFYGDDEFALLSYCDGWAAHMGSRNSAVHVAETGGRFVGEGRTPEDAVSNLLAVIRGGSPNDDD